MALPQAPLSAFNSEREFLLWHFRQQNPNMAQMTDDSQIVFSVKPKIIQSSGKEDSYETTTIVTLKNKPDNSVKINYKRIPLWDIWGHIIPLLPKDLPGNKTDEELETLFRQAAADALPTLGYVTPNIDFNTLPIEFKRSEDGKKLSCKFSGFVNTNEIYSYTDGYNYSHQVLLIVPELEITDLARAETKIPDFGFTKEHATKPDKE